MNKDILIAIRVSIFTLFLTGLLYPFLVTEFSTLLFYRQANGSLIMNDQKKMIGSELIGQNFTSPSYFFPRPSAAGKGYDGMKSGGSNFAQTSKKLLRRIQGNIEEIKKDNSELIPIDLVTASGSGLDPHISPQAAYWQAPRIAVRRDVSLNRLITIIEDLTESPQFRFLGEARVNVLKLNFILDQFFGPPVSFP
ncbi:MAG TPA: potassium-transporting ATPase subunit KdpC [Alphaproteobacteria bacterium]|nr:potassium-transporting ATPase subunit KdpC [Alphaproteobacteria bacterium]